MADEQSDIHKGFAVVAMIDALGVRNSTTQEAISFIKAFYSLEAAVPRFLDKLLKSLGPGYESLSPEGAFYTRTFGDTVILIWETPPNGNHLKALLVTGLVVSYMIIRGLERGLRLRGAVSLGEIVCSSNSVLGPVVADVASWCEAPELIGVVATPMCGQHLGQIDANAGLVTRSADEEVRVQVGTCYRRYDVPLKGYTRSLWAVNWPRYIRTAHGQRDPLDWYFEQTSRSAIPFGSELKYDHTEAFVRSMLELEARQPTS